MSVEVIRFREIKRTITRRSDCPVCGRRVQRSLTLSETVNPWNVGADGNPKSASEVLQSVEQKLRDWVPDFTHEKCKESGNE